MSDFITPMLQWLHAHPHLAGLVTFGISAAESVAVIGTIIPGSVVMTAIGALAGAKVIPLYPILAWAILGAIVGDGISYWLGYYFKDKIRTVWPFRNNPYLLKNGERFCHKYGAMSVLIGRFVGPVRALVPMVAGMLGMKPLRFTIANVLSAIGWAPVYMLPGIVVGAASSELAPETAVHAILVLLLIGLFVVFCIWLLYTLFRLINQQITHLLNKTWKRLTRSRYFHFTTFLLKHHNPTQTHGQLKLTFYFILTACSFCVLATYIHFHPASTIVVNNAFFYLFRGWRTPSVDLIMLWLTLLGDKKIVITGFLALLAWLIYKKRWHTAFHTALLLFLTSITVVTLKHLIASPRPWGIVNSPESFSFPSGHTTLSVVFYLGLSILLVQKAHLIHKKIIYFFMGSFVFLISFSRIYLGAHWFTDVLGGWLLGSALLILVAISYNRKNETRLHAKGIILVALLSLTVASSLLYSFNFTKLQRNYSLLAWPTTTLSEEQWWQQVDTKIPVNRTGRLGSGKDALNIQWLGDLTDIETTLKQNGWDAPSEKNWIDVFYRVTDVSSSDHLPLVAPLYLDQKPVLELTKRLEQNKKLMVLRLWNSNVLISPTEKPLWVGTVGFVPRTYSWLIPYKNHFDLTQDLLLTTTFQHYQARVINLIAHTKNKIQTQQLIIIKPKNKP